MTFRTFTLDLTDRVSEIRERLDEIEGRKSEIEREVEEAMLDQNVNDPTEIDQWDSLSDEDSELSDEKTSLTGELRSFLDTVVHWKTDLDVTTNPDHEEVLERYEEVESCRFVVEELSFGQIQSVSDDMMEKSFDVDMENQDVDGTPKQGYMQIELLREAIQDWPENSPERSVQYGAGIEPDPADYPEEVAQWLFDKVDALNTTQEAELGNLSLEERMRLQK